MFRHRSIDLKAAVPLLAVLAVAVGSLAAEAEQKKGPRRRQGPNPAYAEVVDDPKLPRVLVIGDSISIGYTLPLRELLQGKANVHRIPTNGGPTTRGLEHIDSWLGDGKWDVIHFNWGLHDLKQMADRKDPNLPDLDLRQVPPEEYEKNLRALVVRLKKTGAKLIWATTTPVPEGSAGRTPGDAAKYNEIAARIMAAEGVAIDDLYSFAKPQLETIQLPANVHFKPAGSQALAAKVAESINAALPR